MKKRSPIPLAKASDRCKGRGGACDRLEKCWIKQKELYAQGRSSLDVSSKLNASFLLDWCVTSGNRSSFASLSNISPSSRIESISFLTGRVFVPYGASSGIRATQPILQETMSSEDERSRPGNSVAGLSNLQMRALNDSFTNLMNTALEQIHQRLDEIQNNDDFGPTFDTDLGPIFYEEEEQFDNPTQDSLLVTRRPLIYDLGPIFNEEAQLETIEQSDPKETKEAAKEEMFQISTRTHFDDIFKSKNVRDDLQYFEVWSFHPKEYDAGNGTQRNHHIIDKLQVKRVFLVGPVCHIRQQIEFCFLVGPFSFLTDRVHIFPYWLSVRSLGRISKLLTEARQTATKQVDDKRGSAGTDGHDEEYQPIDADMQDAPAGNELMLMEDDDLLGEELNRMDYPNLDHEKLRTITCD
ncbi:hypothetical protein F2Q69_00047965 [Brassica cretica]|uniref:Uncharacterized protein n=1 Tax=Brassica cretica TaxID=69181 RepID=A0A8S9Q0R1_BRACR|nr:hypothetical protein F2Q69_00047965 [Brassica cretica]